MATLEEYFEKYVPEEGNAPTLGGEIVRAMNQLLYRYNNDGDRVGLDYGKEVCDCAWRFLMTHVASDDIILLLRDLHCDVSDDSYKSLLDCISVKVVRYLDENTDLFSASNVKYNMLDWTAQIADELEE